MSFREKVAWLSIVAMLVGFGPYFVAMGIVTRDGSEPPIGRSLVWFAAAALTQALILGLGYWYLRSTSPLDARTPPDERDRAIERRSVAAAYHILIIGMIVVGIVMPFNSGGWKITNAAVFAIVLAEVVHYSYVAASYRRQS
jgi:hypothetical protein